MNQDRTVLKCYMADTGLLTSRAFDENGRSEKLLAILPIKGYDRRELKRELKRESVDDFSFFSHEENYGITY